MSNPFRRKINAEAAQSSIPANPPPTSQPLSINTTGSRPEKHVRIASPPDTAISPASYPSSPEFVRLSPSPQLTVVPYTFNTGPQTPIGHSFVAADSSGDDEDEEVVSEALKNTRLNIAASRTLQVEAPNTSESAVQNTLSKFASRPRDGKTQVADPAPKQEAKRQTMDVDAFARLLLTGGGSPHAPPGGPSNVSTTGPPNTLSESSSTADSASISRQSIFEPMPPIAAESPRTSHELDENDSMTARRAATSGEPSEAIKKPPPAPRPRHGKPIKPPQPPSAIPETKISSSATGPTSPVPRSPESDLDKPLPMPPLSDSSRRSSSTSIVGTDPSMQTKRPPTPPLNRRRSQGPSKPPLSRSSPSLQSSTSISQSPSSSSSLSQPSKAPPPPPSRRTSQRLSETTTLSSLPSTSEETDPDTEEGPNLSKPIIPRNALSRTTSTITRASFISSENIPPPPPPPRRQRGSSNASMRPTISMTSSNQANVSGDRAENARNTSDGSNRDILKDLASLQAEVDALRRQGLRE